METSLVVWLFIFQATFWINIDFQLKYPADGFQGMSIIFYRSPVDFYQRGCIPPPFLVPLRFIAIEFFIKFWFQKNCSVSGGREVGWVSARELSQRGWWWMYFWYAETHVEIIFVVDLYCWGSSKINKRCLGRVAKAAWIFNRNSLTRNGGKFGFSDSWGSNFYHNILFRGFPSAFRVCFDASQSKHNRTRRQNEKSRKFIHIKR